MRVLLSALGVVVAVIAFFGARALVRGGGADGPSTRSLGTKRVSMPSSAPPLYRLTDAGGRKVEAAFRTSVAKESTNDPTAPVYTDVAVGVFASGPHHVPALMLVTNDTHNAGVVTLLRASTDSANADSYLNGAGYVGTKAYAAGPLGGSLKCGLDNPKDGMSGCVWFDSSSFGFVIGFTRAPTATVAAQTLLLRNAAEH